MASPVTRGAAMASPRPVVLQPQVFNKDRRTTKCVTCGNTAMGKCDFRACGTCCVKARNPCQAHGSKQGTVPVNPFTPENPQQRPPQMQWVPGAGSPYIRPPNGQVPPPYMNQMMRYRVPYTSPLTRMPTPPPVETEAQKEARLEKARKNLIYAQKEALMINSWRVIKMKANADEELSFEDDAFDRYMRCATLLEETTGTDHDEEISADTFEDGVEPDLQDVAFLRHDSNNREAQRQKLQRAVAKSFQKFRKKEAESENMLEIREFNQQAGIGRRDTKRVKVQTQDGKERLRRINAWEELFQGIGSFSTAGEMRNFLEQFASREEGRGEQQANAGGVAGDEKVPPVRRLVSALMKQKQVPEAVACSKVELSEDSFNKLYDSRDSYCLERL